MAKAAGSVGIGARGGAATRRSSAFTARGVSRGSISRGLPRGVEGGRSPEMRSGGSSKATFSSRIFAEYRTHVARPDRGETRQSTNTTNLLRLPHHTVSSPPSVDRPVPAGAYSMLSPERQKTSRGDRKTRLQKQQRTHTKPLEYTVKKFPTEFRVKRHVGLREAIQQRRSEQSPSQKSKTDNSSVRVGRSGNIFAIRRTVSFEPKSKSSYPRMERATQWVTADKPQGIPRFDTLTQRILLQQLPRTVEQGMQRSFQTHQERNKRLVSMATRQSRRQEVASDVATAAKVRDAMVALGKNPQAATKEAAQILHTILQRKGLVREATAIAFPRQHAESVSTGGKADAKAVGYRRLAQNPLAYEQQAVQRRITTVSQTLRQVAQTVENPHVQREMQKTLQQARELSASTATKTQATQTQAVEQLKQRVKEQQAAALAKTEQEKKEAEQKSDETTNRDSGKGRFGFERAETVNANRVAYAMGAVGEDKSTGEKVKSALKAAKPPAAVMSPIAPDTDGSYTEFVNAIPNGEIKASNARTIFENAAHRNTAAREGQRDNVSKEELQKILNGKSISVEPKGLQQAA